MPDLNRRQLLLVITGVAAVATIAIGVYGLARGPGNPPIDDATDHSRQVRTAHTDAHPWLKLSDRSLPHTSDPIRYARAVATALFDWDTASGFLPTDYTAPVLADADPTGEETPDLITDVGTYLPNVDQWLDLAAMDVAQSLEIETAHVPASWATALEQAHGQLRPGTTAVTITGARHRSGTWNGEPAAASYPVAFTVFVACPPAFDRCHLLRLSELDTPLR